MPYFQHGTAKIYYEESGSGEPIIATHGLIENTAYWSKTGVAAALAEKYHVILMDMRAHGRTLVEGEPEGFDVDTMGTDLAALADHLGLERFHVISHSTGGFVAARWAMDNSRRLLSLILTDTGSFTTFFTDARQNKIFHENFAQSFERNDWDKVMAGIKRNPFPFFKGIAEREDNAALWDLALEIIEIGDRPTIGRFIRSFYKDPDPRVEGLRRITCPTLILCGDKDDLFIEPSKFMSREIPGAKLIMLEDTGHMIAIERPERVSREILDFLSALPA